MAVRRPWLLSGGLDSATALAEAKPAGFELNALTIHYGQRHAVEIEAARRVARARSRPPRRARDRPSRLRRQRPDCPIGKFPRIGPTRTIAQGIPSPTCRPETPSSSRSPWPGPRPSAHSTSSSASTASITRAIPTAARSTCGRSRTWPIWRRGPGSRERAGFRIHAPLA